ncbi:unnamed protein product [Rotaria sordida]|uniref:Uncharacterized protein n=1 Tax=Rotaria sordida TaxID=392033 RepID=A0A815EKM8_9BILA|nr:unnamed protein product [Rotaria sordida]CAF1101205.1 unnamed protein product [Rotaria sordida]CAF1132474.1 unnamed protein product [Rotaria sordida]CAF1312797.1 unnamed protein product [Rotaria sordida]CAF1313427.1 unnamed protein product [Rotaria sordida]
MSYRFIYPNGGNPTIGYGIDPTFMSTGYPNIYNDPQRFYSPESYSSDSDSSDDYEYEGRMITRETKCLQDIVRASTPPPIIKRVVERAPTPEPAMMERVIIRPQAQEIVERVIEQSHTPPPRLIQKEMQEEAPPPIVRTRIIKVDRPLCNGYNQSGSPYNQLSSFSNDANNSYRSQSIGGSVGRPAVLPNRSFSSSSSFEYISSKPMASVPPSSTMILMSASQQAQPFGIMQQPQQQTMYRPFHMPSSLPPPPLSSSFIPQNYTYPVHHPGMSFGYRPMMQPGRMIPNVMPMMTAMNTFGIPTNNFPNQSTLFNPMIQPLVY